MVTFYNKHCEAYSQSSKLCLCICVNSKVRDHFGKILYFIFLYPPDDGQLNIEDGCKASIVYKIIFLPVRPNHICLVKYCLATNIHHHVKNYKVCK